MYLFINKICLCFSVKKERNVTYIHNGIYVAVKKNEIMTLAGKQMELDIVILSEISQT